MSMELLRNLPLSLISCSRFFRCTIKLFLIEGLLVPCCFVNKNVAFAQNISITFLDLFWKISSNHGYSLSGLDRELQSHMQKCIIGETYIYLLLNRTFCFLSLLSERPRSYQNYTEVFKSARFRYAFFCLYQ